MSAKGKSAVPLPQPGGVVPPPPGELGDSEDYMNEEPEGVFHTYSNHKELLEQVRTPIVHLLQHMCTVCCCTVFWQHHRNVLKV